MLGVYQVVYESRSSRNLSVDDMSAILRSSIRNNGRLGISGILAYCRGRFMQVLEGDRGAVDEVFARIMQDDRHRSLVLLSGRTVNSRVFGNWQMGFLDWESNPILTPEAFSELIRSIGSEVHENTEQSDAIRRLAQFAAGRVMLATEA